MLNQPPGIDPVGLFSCFEIGTRDTVIAAVSGGSDSTALLLLLKDRLDLIAPRTRLVAVTIDHALRPESPREAEAVGRLCAELGIPHRIRTWSDIKPVSGLAAAAREARHRLLADAARTEGTDLVFTGHTRDDQAETVLMREARAETGRGLAGIAPATLVENVVWFARPLLAARRQALRAFLMGRRTGWSDDPSNADERHERARIRRRLSGLDGEAAIVSACGVAARAAEHRETLGRTAAGLIHAHAVRLAPGLLRLSPEFFASAEREASLYAFRILLAVAGGKVHLPDELRATKLYARMAASASGRAVLSGALVDRRKAGVFLLRERRHLPGAAAIHAGASWDGRYRIAASAGDGGTTPPESAAPPDAAPASLLRWAEAAQPVVPPGLTAIPILAPWAHYLPSFDIVAARATAALVGAPPIHRPPLRDHNESKA